MNIYLDLCCLKRPFDDQTQARIHLESEAILEILKRIDLGRFSLSNSEILSLENCRDPESQRRNRVAEILARTGSPVILTETSRQRSYTLVEFGFKPFDALHLVSAEQAKAEFFLSCDDQLLNLARHHAHYLEVRVLDPIEFIRSRADE